MTIALLATFARAGLLLAKSSLLLAVGYGATTVLRRAPAAARHAAWLTAIVGVLLVPVLDRYAAFPLYVLPTVAGQVALRTPTIDPVASAVAAITSPPSAASPGLASAPRRATLPPFAPHRVDAVRVAFAVWSVVALMLLLRLIVSVGAIARLARRGRVLDSDEWVRALVTATDEVPVSATPRLVMSDEVEMAFTFDALSPVIVLPASASEWSTARCRSVLLHELAHIRRHDLIGHGIAAVVCALNWYNPLIWLAARRLRVESELASDEIVLKAGVRPSVYAQHLLDMVTGVRRRAPGMALAMARPKEFEGRLVAILDPIRSTPMPARRHGVVISGLLALAVVSIGAIAPVPRRFTAPPISAARGSVPSPAGIATPATAAAFAPRAGVPSSNRASARLEHSIRRDVSQTVAPDRAGSKDVAPSRFSRAAADLLLRYGTSGVMNPMIMLLREADALALTGRQADSIATLNRLYMVRLSAIWGRVSGSAAALADVPGEHSVNDGVNAERESTRLLVQFLPALNGVLDADQRARVSSITARYLDPREVEAIAATSPTGVFIPDSERAALFGRGRGGGRGGG